MPIPPRPSLGVGKGRILLFLLLSLAFIAGWKIFTRSTPTIQIQGPLKGIGHSTPLNFEVTDARNRIKQIEVELHQGERVFTVLQSALPAPVWWKFWARGGQTQATFSTRIGRKEIPELQEGRATLRIRATNNSWGRFLRGNRGELALDLPVRFAPPQVQVLSFPHYVNQGGAELVVFKVSAGTVESGVGVGPHFFPSWPVKPSLPETRMCLFAFPYNFDTSTPLRIVARDDAGNETLANFTYRVIPKNFPKDTLNVTDEFIARVVPPILSQTPELQGQGSPLRNFLIVNGLLRRQNAQQLVALAQRTQPGFLWTRPFLQLSNSKVEAAFADRRTYVYNGEVIDHQDHLGFDLAVTEHIPVVAANDGVVVHAGFLGIYGNALVVDHGCGLQSLYAHLSALNVKPGQAVKRGEVMGRSGQTGLAAGDHLHFTTLLAGIPINPVEWWDAHWIRDRIEAKLAAYK